MKTYAIVVVNTPLRLLSDVFHVIGYILMLMSAIFFILASLTAPNDE